MPSYYIALECSAGQYEELERNLSKWPRFHFQTKQMPGLHYLILKDAYVMQKLLLFAGIHEIKCLQLDEQLMRQIYRRSRITGQDGHILLLGRFTGDAEGL